MALPAATTTAAPTVTSQPSDTPAATATVPVATIAAPVVTVAPAVVLPATQAPAAVQPTHAPAAQPTSPAAVTNLTIVQAPGTVATGEYAMVVVQTAPGASCNLAVRYKSGYSKAHGVGPTTADASGRASWTWQIGTNTTSGTWPVTITCNGQQAQTTVTVP